MPDGHEERAAYVLSGSVEVSGDVFAPGRMLIFRAGDRLALRAGADGARYLFWNFVSSSRERIEQAKGDWRAGRFGWVPGDEREFIPLPEGRETMLAEGGGLRMVAPRAEAGSVRESPSWHAPRPSTEA